MENVINHDLKSRLSSDFLKFQPSCMVARQQYNESNLKESDACIKIKDSGYFWNHFKLTIQKLRCLICFSKGLSPKKSAAVLGISYQTFTYHLIELRYRLGFSSKKSMIDKLRLSDFGQNICTLPTDIHDLWELIVRSQEGGRYLRVGLLEILYH